MNSVAYRPLFTKSFQGCIEQNRRLEKRVHQLVARILKNPYQNSHPLGNKYGKDLRGKRSRPLTQNFVVVFQVIEEKNQVIFHAFGTHKAVYRA